MPIATAFDPRQPRPLYLPTRPRLRRPNYGRGPPWSVISTSTACNASQLRDKTPELREKTPELREKTPELREKTPELREKTPELREKTPELREKTPELRDKTIELREKTPELRDKTSSRRLKYARRRCVLAFCWPDMPRACNRCRLQRERCRLNTL